MAFNVVSTIVNFFKDTLHSFGIESLNDKTTEFVDNNIKVPRLIDNIEGQLNYRYGRELFYNDFCEYINTNKSIEKAIRMFYETKSSDIIPKDRFVEDNLNNFRAKNREYSPYEYSLVKECFALIYEEVFSGIIDLNSHSDAGKLMAANAMFTGQISDVLNVQTELLQNISADVSQLVNASAMLNPIKDDFGPTSEKVENFLKKIDSVGNEDNPVSDAESALLRYRELSSEAFITLRGENEKQIDKVVCAINCHMAICYGNLGEVENAFECLKQISPVAAEESKQYQFVKAVLIVNNSLEDKYKEAENCLNRALELDSNHRRAYLVSRYLLVLQGTISLEEVLRPLEVYFEKVLSENKERELIADYYIYRGFICKEYEAFDLAEKSFVSAREYGYDEVIVDYNLSILYYGKATKELPRDTRIFCTNLDTSLLKKAMDLLRKWLFDRKEEKIPTYIKSRMVGVYASVCALLGIKHELAPLDEYLKLPNLEYEVQRMLIMGAEGITDKTSFEMLDKDDALYVQIVNKLDEDKYNDVKKALLLMSEEEKKNMPVTTVYLILQASIANHDLEIYHDFRKYIKEVDAIGLIECIDAYATEESGDIEFAKSIMDKYASESKDYHLLRNIVGFYARNEYDAECEKLLVRILALSKEEEIYIDDKPGFYKQAVNFLVSHKSEHAKSFIESIDIENEQMWRLKAYFYDEIKDIPHLLEVLTLLHQSTRDYSIGYNEVVCLMKMMKYDTALVKAKELLTTVDENNIKHRVQVFWMISNLHLFLGQNQESYEWAKKAHELTVDIPGNESHGAYLARATRVGHVDESLANIIEYKKQHPVVISEWMKEVKMPEDNSGEGFLHALENALGQSHEEYAKKEKEVGILYRKGVLPNSTVLKRYGNDIAQLFIFANKNKLRISNGNWTSLEGKKTLVGEHILVDSVTLLIMQRYECLDAIKNVKCIHICYATLAALQEMYPSLNYHYAESILEWIKKADNIVFEPDGYDDTSNVNILSDEVLVCCRVAGRMKIPFLTSEVLLENLISIKEYQLPQSLQVISIVALCYATMSNEPDKLSQMIYNLLADCSFINFTSEIIIEIVKKNNYVVSENEMKRFFICNTSCDMISFAKVYLGVIELLHTEHYEAALDFSSLVLDNAMQIWRRGTHYREMSERYGSKSDGIKAKEINTYLVYLTQGMKKIYGTVPSEIAVLLDDVMKKGIQGFSKEVFSEIMAEYKAELDREKYSSRKNVKIML